MCSTVSVEYLECDLGQTEFTPPGCLSLNTVTEPLLGMCHALNLHEVHFSSPVSFSRFCLFKNLLIELCRAFSICSLLYTPTNRHICDCAVLFLGPPFTHLRDPEHMVYYGQADCQADIDRYLDSLKSLWRHIGGESPVIINTMGWIRGQQ